MCIRDRAGGCTSVMLCVECTNLPAVELYQGMGFVEVDSIEGYYPANVRGLVMARDWHNQACTQCNALAKSTPSDSVLCELCLCECSTPLDMRKHKKECGSQSCCEKFDELLILSLIHI
eukprot:TRINITY_DN4495_c0_g1_i1.p1 TRINITY_DN4495_c0_g1~~TRINITY_DN4495_c0_g1_i1.p1  ORF type:complete len:119 (+),score=33.36 TRINITY_DN4495_c0_g1_i1:168-524(+)